MSSRLSFFSTKLLDAAEEMSCSVAGNRTAVTAWLRRVFAALSAATSFPVMPTCPGTQQNTITEPRITEMPPNRISPNVDVSVA